MRVLYLTHEAPWPIDSGLRVRCAQIAGLLAREADVTVAALAETGSAGSAPEGIDLRLAPYAVRIRRKPLRLLKEIARAVAGGRAYSFSKFDTRSVRSAVEEIVSSVRPDVIVSTAQMGAVAEAAGGGRRLVLDSHNIEHEMWASCLGPSAPRLGPATRWFVRREAGKLREEELRLWALADSVVSICDEDAGVIRGVGGEVRVVPASVEALAPSPIERPGGDGLVGVIANWGWPPNKWALAWFVDRVLPELRERAHDVVGGVLVGGGGLGRSFTRRLEHEGVTVCGRVDDLDAWYKQLSVVALPQGEGGGVRLKTLDAMARGLPVVGRPLAFRGIRGEPEDFSGVAEAPAEFAGACACLLRDSAEAARLGRAARAAYEKHLASAGSSVLGTGD